MTILSLKDKNDALVVVPQDCAILIAPWGSADIPDKITVDTDGTLDLFPGFRSVGEIQKSGGVGIAPDTQTAEIEGYGSLPTRRTIKTKEGFTLSAVFQEIRDITLQTWLDTSLADIVVDANGEWRVVKTAQAQVNFYSVILIGQDGSPGNEVYPYVILPKCSISKSDEFRFQMDKEIALSVTFSAYEDKNFGTQGGYVAFGMAGKANQQIAIEGGFGTATDEIQTLTITGTPTGGNFKLQFNERKTAAIAHNANAAAIQSALEAVKTIGTGNVTVTGSGPYTITFAATLGDKNVPELLPTDLALTGGTNPTVTVTTGTQGVS